MKPLWKFSFAYLLILAAGCSHKTSSDTNGDAKDATPTATPVVQVALVHVGTIEQILNVTGTLSLPQGREASVSPSVSGIVDQLPVRVGQQVTKGQLVAHLDTRTLEGQIQQAQATIAQNQVQVLQAQANALQQSAQGRSAVLQAQSTVGEAQATLSGARATLAGNEAALRNAQQSLERTQGLFHEGLVAQKDVETAQLAVRTAEAQVEAQVQTVDAQKQTVRSQQVAVAAAKAGQLQDIVKRQDIEIARQQVGNARGALNTARAQISLYTLHAPVTGQVTSLGATSGAAVDTSTKLVTIANLDTLQLQIAVPAANLTEVRAGQGVRFHVESVPSRTYTGVISIVGRQVDAASNTISAVAIIPNPDHKLANGTIAQVQIVTGRHGGALLVPKSAVLRDEANKASVMIVDADKTAHQKDVKIGYTQSETVEILSGVEPKQQVITQGAYGLPDETKVEIEQKKANP